MNWDGKEKATRVDAKTEWVTYFKECFCRSASEDIDIIVDEMAESVLNTIVEAVKRIGGKVPQ
jgi:hypothetical protein